MMNGVPWWFFLHAKGAFAGQELKAVDPDGRRDRLIDSGQEGDRLHRLYCSFQ